ncbi:metal ABC transporter permease [Candidatus Uhrbacteria bacterium]|nr:metal ABC transporter permease [Candidatus Uhrbacteria bacterium]
MFEIFQFDFMQRAFGAGIAIAIIAPTIGIFLVVRRFSLISDTLAHVSLAGVAVAALTGTNAILTAMITTVLAAFGIERLRFSRNIFGESVLAIFLSGSLALSSILFGLSRGRAVGLSSILFGSITTVSPGDVRLIVTLAIIVTVIILALYPKLFAVAFDEEVAQVNGLPVQLLNTVIMILAAMSVALAIRIVGALLIGALMVMPVVAALQWKLSFQKSLWLAIAFSLLAVLSGLFISYYWDLASGGTIVLVALLTFTFSLVMNRR